MSGKTGNSEHFGPNDRRKHPRRDAHAPPVYLFPLTPQGIACSAIAVDWCEKGLGVATKHGGEFQVGDELEVTAVLPTKVKARIVYIETREDTKDTRLGLVFEDPPELAW